MRGVMLDMGQHMTVGLVVSRSLYVGITGPVCSLNHGILCSCVCHLRGDACTSIYSEVWETSCA